MTACIFVTAISEFDQKLYEDASTNRMDEAVTLYDQICNHPSFGRTSMILFLNKRDLFREKIEVCDIAATPAFADYAGGRDYDAGCAYFTAKFVRLNTCDDRVVYHHITCATDTRNIAVVMGSCKDIILKANMESSGLM